LLQQSTAFRPFMQQFIMFAAITGRASYHEVFRAIRAASTERYHVVNMVRCQLPFAVVTLALLSLVLLLNILSGMTALCLSLAGIIIALTNIGAIAMIYSPSPGNYSSPSGMSFAVITAPLSIPFRMSVSFCPLLGKQSYMMPLAIGTRSLTLSTRVMYLLFLISLLVLILVSKIVCLHRRLMLLFVRGYILFTLLANAFLTCCSQFERTFALWVKEVSCCGVLIATFRALLRGIHELNRLSFSCLASVVARMQGYISLRGLITPSLDNKSIIPFFASQQKR